MVKQITIYDVGNQNPGLGQAQNVAGLYRFMGSLDNTHIMFCIFILCTNVLSTVVNKSNRLLVLEKLENIGKK
jgi:hypothetical protein